jgi:hypothetical protein
MSLSLKDTDNTLYDLVHTPVVKTYWIKKQRAREDNFEFINWARIGNSLDNMPLTKRFFCSKHTVGMCGVGKFQQIWKKRESAACPHCGQFEDALHIWKCSADSVTEVWKNSLKNLESYMRTLDTDPILLKIILDYLNTWRNGELLIPLADHKYKMLIELQETIGARQFFEGWTHHEWEKLQEQYYSGIKSRRRSKRWATALITKLWNVAWDL